jgi:HK97 family phage prohead protease
MEPDFSGYATKTGIQCSDGRTITTEAFAHMNGQRVPLVWQHGHGDPTNVLGHVDLEARSDGMYAKGYFNSTAAGKHAKAMVQHGDISSMSIYANQLKEHAKKVLHGVIREVSLVLSGANPGAKIDFVAIQHDGGDIEELEDVAVITTGLELEHTSPEDEVEKDEEAEKDDEEIVHAVGPNASVQDVVDTMDPEQKNVLAYLVAQALDRGNTDNGGSGQASTANSAAHSEKITEGDLEHQEGTKEMPRNVFEQNGAKPGEDQHTLSHDDVKGIVQDALKLGSLRDAIEGYALKHGIDDIDTLFPDAQTVEQMPQFNKRRTEWVSGVLNGTRHSPFSRVKTIWADLTQADARAKGYIKGNYKIEEWFAVTKRTTDPTTIYKKQRLDRDDVIDITSFDVVAWIKQEMRLMLEEELARAILLGDGRDVADEDKIKDPMGAPAGDGIRSILNDHELFVTTVNVNVDDANSSYDEVVDAVMDGMEYYKGSGTPTFYTTIRNLNKFFKAKDGMSRRLYNNKAEVAAALGVADIVTVEPMNDYAGLIGVIVNLDDYTIGADKGGEVSMFDDFDIDYNQLKYLIETRLSGGLTKIKSAIVVRSTGATAQMLATPTKPTYDGTTHVVTVPTVANVIYKNADTGATLSAGAQPALSAGQRLNVQAVAASGYYFNNDADTLWTYFRRS